ncbi:MAG: diphosphomevalonate decarboxylase [Gammaproteobacteria bacterium]|nr:diphosphomevalonate decarboxylase [Gammaproteobacteria bacterium]MDH5303167.1 diphosphomevalonate decarboxylase [Gammaproteobacteria bacterium]MDH5320825.1 diphosphomevalonate decarboxylase [Gammaproteobacteria bacterium]
MRASAIAQPNIAVIKYWGKRDLARNLPAVGSISVTLSTLYTEMQVEIDTALAGDVLLVNAEENRSMLARVSDCVDIIAGIDRPAVRVSSKSNFPIAAGIASSASAFAALVVAAAAAFGLSIPRNRLAQLAGRASGSAARSMLGGFVELENDTDNIRVGSLLSAADWPLEILIAITAPGPKPVSSGDAMEISRRTSPFYDLWIEQQAADLAEARAAIRQRDLQRLGAIAEHNCLKMHSVMWGSRPPMIYWNSATIACMQTIRELQARGVAVFFTIDAGPQLKAICAAADVMTVRTALLATDGVLELMQSGIGEGARLVSA